MKKGRVLIVEDEIITAMGIKNLLEKEGYQVSELTLSGPEAIERAEQDRPDLVLMDIRMEGGMTGIEAAEKIHSRFGIPIIFITGYADKEIKENAIKTGAAAYLEKPLDLNRLISVIESVLKKK